VDCESGRGLSGLVVQGQLVVLNFAAKEKKRNKNSVS